MHCLITVCMLSMLLILVPGKNLPEVSRALGSGGLEESGVDLGGPFTRHSIAQGTALCWDHPLSYNDNCAGYGA